MRESSLTESEQISHFTQWPGFSADPLSACVISFTPFVPTHGKEINLIIDVRTLTFKEKGDWALRSDCIFCRQEANKQREAFQRLRFQSTNTDFLESWSPLKRRWADELRDSSLQRF